MSRFLGLVALGFLLSGCLPSHSRKPPPAAVKGVLDLRQWDFAKDGPVTLNGEWEFYWKKFKEDIGPGDLPGIIQPGAWNSFVFEGEAVGSLGYGTYRLKILLPPGPRLLALKTGGYDSAATLKAESLVHSIGRPGRTRDATLPVYRQDIVDIDAGSEQIDLFVETSNFYHHKGGMLAAPVLDKPSSLRAARLREQMWQGMLAATFLIFGIYHLLLHAIRRNSAAFYFGLYCVFFFVRTLQTGEENIHILLPELDFRVDLFFEYLGLFLYAPIFALFVDTLFPAELPRFLKNFFIVAGCGYCFSLLLPPETYSRFILGFQVVILLAVVWAIYVAARAALHSRPGARVFLAGFALLGAGVVVDVAFNMLYSISTPFASLGMVGFVLSQAIVIAKRFSDALSESERLSRVLQAAYADAVGLREKLVEKEKMATIGDMAAGIVHDLKNPVGIIKGSAELADDDSFSRDQRRAMLQIINQEADRMLAMTQDLLDFSQGSVYVQKQTVDQAAYLERVQTVLLPNFADKNIRFSISADGHGSIHIDPDKFLRVLVNIAGNAADVLASGGLFEISVSHPGHIVRFALRDNGPGIPADIRETLFQPFVTRGKSHGTGLGMAIAKSMVEAHGGTISFETQTGKGTTFIIEVPA